MNHLKRAEEVELRLITRYQPGGCACRVQDLQSLGASLSWSLIAAITAKWGWGLFACFAHNLWGEVRNSLRWQGVWTYLTSYLALLGQSRGCESCLAASHKGASWTFISGVPPFAGAAEITAVESPSAW